MDLEKWQKIFASARKDVVFRVVSFLDKKKEKKHSTALVF